MEYLYVPQQVYKINGEPAKTYGEWPGIKSNHWNGSIKIIRAKAPEQIFDETSAPLLGRRHFSAKISKERMFVPGKKMFSGRRDLENIEEKKKGIKLIGEPKRPEYFQTNRKHFPPRHGKEIYPEPFYIRTFHPDQNCCTFQEMMLEKEFGIKKKILTLQEKRNYMEIKNPGDKAYKVSEQSSNFFKEGGLIPGSTNKFFNRTQNLKNNNFYETLDLNVKTLKDEKKWKNKVKQETLETDQKYVKTLGIWEDKILQDYIVKEDDTKEKAKAKETKEKPGNKRVASKGNKKK